MMTGCEGLIAGNALACNEKMDRLDTHSSSGYIPHWLSDSVTYRCEATDVLVEHLFGFEAHRNRNVHEQVA